MQVRYAFSLTRVWQHYNKGTFAIVSAYRSDSPDEENEARTQYDPARDHRESW